MVFCIKYAEFFRVFVLHPALGWRKIKVDATKHLGKAAMVTVIVEGKQTRLFLDAEKKQELSQPSSAGDVEEGDVVLIELHAGDSEAYQVASDVHPAVVETIVDDEATFTLIGPNSSVSLPISRIVLAE